MYSQKPEQVQTIFNRIAPVYDRLNDWLSLGQHRVWKMMTVKWCQPQPNHTCLDLCCGSGDLALLLAREVGETGRVFGLDFSSAQLAIASSRTPFEHSSPITWLEGDALNIPFPNNTFDAITMGYGLRNITNILRSLQEIERVLKPGAIGAILDFHRPSSPLMANFQQWYLDQIVVPMAQHFGVREEYAYIMPSLERFPSGPAQVQLAKQAGFSQVTHYQIGSGMMGVLVVQKSVINSQ